MLMESNQIQVTVRAGTHSGAKILNVVAGANLREALLEQGLTPYKSFFQSINCKGLGICGSCRVGVRENGTIWARRSCQIRCFQDMEIELQ